MKVLLFNPPVRHYQGIHYKMNPPLGLPIIASVLRSRGHVCEVADLEALGVDPEVLRMTFARQRTVWPDAVGLTCLTSSRRGAREAVTALREAGFGGRIVLGGPHPTIEPEEVLSWKGVDAVVRGECEANVEEIFSSSECGVFEGKPLPIEEIPAPAWAYHTPAPETYLGNMPFIAHPEAITMFSRGCPWRCVFCANPVFGHTKTRYRPVGQIARELTMLKGRGAKALFVYDDELLGAPAPPFFFHDLAGSIRDLKLQWKCQGRCSSRHVDKGTLALLAASGLRAVMWGVESFSPRVLRAIRKGTDPSDIWHTLRRSKRAGIKNWVFTMIGNLEEGDEELAHTAMCLKEAYREGLIDYRQTTVATPVRGTEFYARAKEEGFLVEQPESGPQMAQIYAPTKWLSSDRIAYWMRVFDEACPVGPMGPL